MINNSTTPTDKNVNTWNPGAGANSDIIVSLDIGTTKICALIARVTPEGKIDVLGSGTAASKGLMRGVIHNVPDAVKAIKEAVEKAEIQSGMRITKVVVGIAGQHIKCFKHRNYLTREINNFITTEDVDELIEQVHKIVLPHGEKVIHVLPVTFKVNNDEGIINPVGMRCTSLEGDFLIVTGHKDSIENIGTCVEQAGLEIAGLILEPIASSISVLNQKEKDAGVALVDIGGGTTDIAIFHKGIIRHTAVIPFGGNSITEDVEEGCEVLSDDAELLKTKHGSSLVLDKFENVIITIPDRFGNNQSHKVSMKNLALIIHARVDEILEEVYHHIRKSDFENKLRAGIVLTGGGSMLKNIEYHCKYLSGLRSRKGGVDHRLVNLREEINSPKFATAVGLALKGIELLRDKKIDPGFVTMELNHSNVQEEVTTTTINNEINDVPEQVVHEDVLDRDLVNVAQPADLASSSEKPEKKGILDRFITMIEDQFNVKGDSPDLGKFDEEY